MKRFLFFLLLFSLKSFSQLQDIKIIIPKDFGFSYMDFVQFLPGEKHFVVCSNALSVLNTETSEIVDEVDLPYLAKNLSINPSGDLLMVCANNELLVYSFKDQKLELVFKSNTAELIKGQPNSEYYGSLPISGCFFTGKGNVAYISIGSFSLLFDVNEKKAVSSSNLPVTDYVLHAAAFPKKQEVILAISSGTITSLIKHPVSNLTQTTTILSDIASVTRLKIRDSLLFCQTADNYFILNLETNKIIYEVMMPKQYMAYYSSPQNQQYLRKPKALGNPDTKNFNEEYIFDMDLHPGSSQAAFATIKGIKFIDLKTGQLIKQTPGIFQHIKFSSEGKRLITNGYTSYKALRVYNTANMQVISERPAMDNPIYFAGISPNKRWLYTKGNVSAYIWDLNNFSKYAEIKDASGKDSTSVYNLFFLSDSEVVVCSGKAYPNFNLSIYNILKKKYTRTIKKNVFAAASGFLNGEFYYADYTSLHIINLKTLAEETYTGMYSLAVSNQYKIINFTKDLVFVPDAGKFKIVNRKTKKTEYESENWLVTAPVILSPDNKFLYTSAQVTKKKNFSGTEVDMPVNAIVKIDMTSKKIVKDFAETYYPYDIKIKDNGAKICIWYLIYNIGSTDNLQESMYTEYNTETGAELLSKTLIKSKELATTHYTSDNGNYFALSDAMGKDFKIFDKTGEQIFNLSDSKILMPNCFFIEELEQVIITGSSSSLAMFVDLKKKKVIGSLANAVNDNFFMITPDYKYMGSKDFIKNIRFKRQSEIYSFEQFDAYLNQPHQVLRAFGCKDSSLIKAYETAYLKRMRVLNIKPGANINFSAAPEFQYVKLQEEKGGAVSFNVSVNKGATKLKQLDVLNNGTVVFTEKIPEEQSSHYEKTIKLESASGINRFEFIAKDEAGLEAPRVPRLFNNTSNVKPNLYLVVIASEKFKNTKFDLSYAVKDASDVSKTMVNSKSFGKIEVKKLFNKSFTTDSVKLLKDFFAKATINDVVMVFFAGHGYLDDDLSYYFPTHYTDFTDPKINSVNFKEFETLFKTMKPIRKLMFVDACFSGEVDEDIYEMDGDDKPQKDKRDIRISGTTFVQSTALEMSKSIFSDLRQNSGATIISSAGGTEAAFEGEKWNNGLFTHCLIDGMTKGKADANKDQKIMLSELQKFVAEEVNQLSNGKQTPTYRVENTVLDYELW
ncbi:MAG: caspase family protein [Bacteroidia bacterium]|nr:caspase family protein [Bacteroidia bacterium]